MFDADLEFLEDDVEIVDLVESGFPRRRYVRANYFQSLDPLGFFKRFRLYKETVLHVLTEIEEELEYASDRNNSVAPIDQLLTALRYYSSGSHLMQTSDFMNMHETTASRLISKVSLALTRIFPRYVNISGEEHATLREQNNFYNIARFLRVIDCTHVRIANPGGQNAEHYRHRKRYFSLNVQVVANSNLELIDVVDRWPGSSHDATIFGHSNLRARFEAGEFRNRILLGDGGYPLRNYMLTPLRNPITREEHLYQESLIRTRNVIERVIGIWKRRFPILAYWSRLNLNTTKAMICATAVLHNIARRMNEPEELPEPYGINADELNYLIEARNIAVLRVLNRNNLQRNDIVQRQIVKFFRGFLN